MLTTLSYIALYHYGMYNTMIISPYDVPKPCYIFRKKINSLFDSIQYEN